jgi:hypothetical protein
MLATPRKIRGRGGFKTGGRYVSGDETGSYITDRRSYIADNVDKPLDSLLKHSYIADG